MKSTMFSLKKRDWLKSLVMAIGAPLVYWIQSIIPGLDLSPEVKVAISAFLTYIAKNFLTDDTKTAVKIIEEAKK